MYSVQLIVQLAIIQFRVRAAKLVHILTLIIYAKLVIATALNVQAPVPIVVHALLGIMLLPPISVSIVQYSDASLVTLRPTIAYPAK